MDVYELKIFVDLSTTLNFTRTGNNCNISPSALSRLIVRLEEEAGAALFIRDRRRVELTDSGRVFADFARETVLKWEELKEDFSQDVKTLKGEISLYCSVTASYSILPDILNRFRAKYPDIHIKLKTGDAGSAIPFLINAEAELAVAVRPAKMQEGLLFKNITDSPLVFIKQRGSKLKDISGPMILEEKGTVRKQADKFFAEKGIQPDIYARVSGNEAIISMVNLGLGTGLVPKIVLDVSPVKDNIEIIKTEPELEPLSIGLCVRKAALKKRQVKAFWDEV
jgi:LysR family positive regulator for ilvC